MLSTGCCTIQSRQLASLMKRHSDVQHPTKRKRIINTRVDEGYYCKAEKKKWAAVPHRSSPVQIARGDSFSLPYDVQCDIVRKTEREQYEETNHRQNVTDDESYESYEERIALRARATRREPSVNSSLAFDLSKRLHIQYIIYIYSIYTLGGAAWQLFSYGI